MRFRLTLAAILAVSDFGVAQSPTWSHWIPPAPTAPGATGLQVRDVSATSPTDVWLVGDYVTSSGTHAYAAHFDGNAWTEVAVPDPVTFGALSNSLTAVSALSPTDVWIGGSKPASTFLGGGAYIAHFDGSAWTLIDPPALYGGAGTRVADIVASGPNDVYFIGLWTGQGFVGSMGWRFDGSNWTFPTPPLVLPTNGGMCVAGFAAGPSDVFAVGGGPPPGAPSVVTAQNVARYDGTSWALNLPPALASGTSYLWTSVDGTGPNEVWICGITEYGNPSVVAGQMRRWNGAQWTTIAAPPASENRIPMLAVFGPSDVLAGGYGGVSHFDGATWTVEQDFTSFGAVVGPFGYASRVHAGQKDGSDLWVCGLQWSAGGVQTPFVALRSVAPPPPPPPLATTALLPPCAAPPPAVSIVALSAPALGGTAAVALYDATTLGVPLGATTSYAYWFASLQPATTTGCGFLAPGFGIGSTMGEVFIGLAPGTWFVLGGPEVFGGPGGVSYFSFPVPALPAYAGLQVWTQGLVVDVGATPADFVLTEGLELILGI